MSCRGLCTSVLLSQLHLIIFSEEWKTPCEFLSFFEFEMIYHSRIISISIFHPFWYLEHLHIFVLITQQKHTKTHKIYKHTKNKHTKKATIFTPYFEDSLKLDLFGEKESEYFKLSGIFMQCLLRNIANIGTLPSNESSCSHEL